MLDNLNIEEIKPSSRRYPAIIFNADREAGDQILSVENLSVIQILLVFYLIKLVLI